ASRAVPPRVILSCYCRVSAVQGPPQILDDPSAWPARVIAMTLARVGSGAGPDLDRLAAVRRIAAGRRIYAAGGVRDAADLAALACAGLAGALVATALHDRGLGRPEVEGLAPKPPTGASPGCASRPPPPHSA